MAEREHKSSISINLFGAPLILVDQQPFLMKRKRIRAMIYYLAVSPAPVCREGLISMFFPQLDRVTALKNLSTYIYNIHNLLPDILSVNKDFLYISPEVYVDVKEFESCTEGDALSIEKAKRAEELYKGSFLSHFDFEDSEEYEQWKMSRSEFYQDCLMKSKRYLADAYAQKGEYAKARDLLGQIIELQPYNEDAYRTAMRVSLQMGNRPDVVSLFERLAHTLNEDLGIPPMPETVKLYTDIITQDLDADYPKTVPKDTALGEVRPDIRQSREDLSDNAKKLLNILVVFYSDFHLRGVSRLLGIPESEVLNSLEELERGGIVRVTADDKILFSNPQEKDVLYHSLSAQKRKYLHLRVAHLMEQMADTGSYYDANLILYHYQRGSDGESALKYALLIGEMANQREDYQIAVECYEQARPFIHGKSRLALDSNLAVSLMLTRRCGEARRMLLSDAESCKSRCDFGLENYFHLEAALPEVPGIDEIMWGIRPQYPIPVKEEVVSNIWIAEKHLVFDEENKAYYFRFLRDAALYYEAAMQPEISVRYYERAMEAAEVMPASRLRNYTNFCCLKLGIYHQDKEKAERYLLIGIVEACKNGNYSILPFLLAAYCELDMSREVSGNVPGGVKVVRHHLDWAESIADSCKNVYAKMQVKSTRAHFCIRMDQKEQAAALLKEVYDLGVGAQSTHALIKACKEILALEEAKPYWGECRRCLDRLMPKTEIMAEDGGGGHREKRAGGK